MSEFSGWSFALGALVCGANLMLMDWLRYRRWRKQDRVKLPRGWRMR